MSCSFLHTFFIRIFLFSLFLLTLGCSGPRPILYPNDHLNQVGQDQAEREIEECKEVADEYVSTNKTATVAGNTAVGAGTGGAIGAVSGAIRGGAGVGAAIGAATGAVAGLFHGLFQASEPPAAYKAFVNQCLRERGYQALGWE